MSELQEGDLAYDVAKQTLVSVVATDMGTIEEQDPAMQDLIVNAEGNKQVGFSSDTRCVEIAYVGVDEGNRTYTMPETRIKRSDDLIRAIRRMTAQVSEEFPEQVDERLQRFQGLDRFTS